ncbi:MAG: SDR family NAD(P)-dependent oxidoreductase, partial [Pseudomonadota bacterium]
MSMDLFNLAGKTALITGSSQGIGYTLAGGLRAAGARIVVNGRSAAKLDKAAAELDAMALPFDVTDHAATRAAVDGFEADHGPIDILINNAGMQHRTPLEDFDPADFERLMATNVTSVFNVGQACARHMIGRGAGK